jgi:hypothetical protein
MAGTTRANHDAPELTAAAVGLVGVVKVTLILLAGIVGEPPAEGYSRALGALLADLLMIGVATWATAHFSSRRWTRWQYLLVAFGYSLLFALLVWSGRQS